MGSGVHLEGLRHVSGSSRHFDRRCAASAASRSRARLPKSVRTQPQPKQQSGRGGVDRTARARHVHGVGMISEVPPMSSGEAFNAGTRGASSPPRRGCLRASSTPPSGSGWQWYEGGHPIGASVATQWPTSNPRQTALRVICPAPLWEAWSQGVVGHRTSGSNTWWWWLSVCVQWWCWFPGVTCWCVQWWRWCAKWWRCVCARVRAGALRADDRCQALHRRVGVTAARANRSNGVEAQAKANGPIEREDCGVGPCGPEARDGLAVARRRIVYPEPPGCVARGP